ncbi:hypothetical protein CMV_021719 [Castanea mollissima]|uniref:Uncharacterized protein n=1 Tax=Castanea mollissima TaxID=60419 RepID=A0A8J4QJB9_9ROSI|nr:hypothetical protein CMV_021719 [Castanea mollissima]
MDGQVEKNCGPSDLVALAEPVHAPGPSTDGDEEDSHGAGTIAGDPTSVSDQSEPARWGFVLEDRHVPHTRHPWLLPYLSFMNNSRSFSMSLSASSLVAGFVFVAFVFG